MKCVKCDEETRVLDSRQAPDNVFRRRRECMACKKRFTTYESVVSPQIVINYRKSKAKRMNRYYHAMGPKRKASYNKRNRLRATAREQVKKTGESLEALYKKWGVD